MHGVHLWDKPWRKMKLRETFNTIMNVYLRHALVDDGIPSGLTDHQISPLHDNNGDEESCVACVLQNLTLGIGL